MFLPYLKNPLLLLQMLPSGFLFGFGGCMCVCVGRESFKIRSGRCP